MFLILTFVDIAKFCFLSLTPRHEVLNFSICVILDPNFKFICFLCLNSMLIASETQTRVVTGLLPPASTGASRRQNATGHLRNPQKALLTPSS